jgi:NTP pyrophosphatase (non-canonical NTP hydrolase)
MNLTEITQLLREFSSERDWKQFHTPRNLSLALVGEVGELAEIAQWRSDGELTSGGLVGERLEEEIADIAIYLIQLADVVGVDLEQAIVKKIEVNALKYPIATSRGKASKYGELPQT